MPETGNVDMLLVSGQLPELVMFDLDGTLVDSVPDLAAAIDNMLLQIGRLPVGEAQVRTWVGNGQWALVERALASPASDNSGPYPDVVLETAVKMFRQHYAQGQHKLTCLYPGVQPFLAWLHASGVRMAIVTNKPKEFVPAILQQLNIAGFFEFVLGGECLTEKKPHPLPLLHCLLSLKVEPERALMVGDSANDLLAAERANVASVAVSYGYANGVDLMVYNPLYLVDSLESLVPPHGLRV